MKTESSNYSDLIQQIGGLLQKGKEQVAQSVNTILVQTYWLIGLHVVEYEQGGNEKSEYGSFLFDQLSKDLTRLYGKGFSRANLLYMRKIYLTFPIREILSNVLSWSHYFEILGLNAAFAAGSRRSLRLNRSFNYRNFHLFKTKNINGRKIKSNFRDKSDCVRPL